MRKTLASVFLAAALLVPAAPAHAQIVRTEECPPGMVGRTVYVGDRGLLYNCYRLPVPGMSTEAGAIVRVTDCPPGYTGYVVQAWNEKRGWYDLVVFCIPFGP